MLAPQEKVKGASCFKHWYYTQDLGDGVVIHATVPNEPQATLGARTNRNILLSLLHRHFGSQENKKKLDLTCSAGYHTLELALQGSIATGVDHDENAISQARFIQECQNIKATFEVMNLFESDFKPESFDLVYCSGLLYHLSDPLGAIQRINHWCSQGAIIHSCIMAGNELWAELGDPARFPFSLAGAFELVPTAPLLRRMFEYAGFEVLEMADLNDYSTDGTLHGSSMRKNWSNVTGPAYFALRKIKKPTTEWLTWSFKQYARAAKRFMH